MKVFPGDVYIHMYGKIEVTSIMDGNIWYKLKGSKNSMKEIEFLSMINNKDLILIARGVITNWRDVYNDISNFP